MLVSQGRTSINRALDDDEDYISPNRTAKYCPEVSPEHLTGLTRVPSKKTTGIILTPLVWREPKITSSKSERYNHSGIRDGIYSRSTCGEGKSWKV